MEEKKCVECRKIINGRSDKRFCDDGCRNAFNNRRNSIEDEMLRTVNSILRKNRGILQDLLSKTEKTTITEKTLKALGFNFEYFTHLYETRKGTIYKFCYEYGYLMISDGVLMLVKRQAQK
jgi:predicted nucleic acid-binding Zn ribbon protein